MLTTGTQSPPSLPPFTGHLTVTLEEGAQPVHYLFLLFTQQLWQFLIDETNRYADHKIAQNPPSHRSLLANWKPVTLTEMKAFIGVILNMGIIQLANIKGHWSTSTVLASSGTPSKLVLWGIDQQHTPWHVTLFPLFISGLCFQGIVFFRSFASSMCATLPFQYLLQKDPKFSHSSIFYPLSLPAITALVMKLLSTKLWLASKAGYHFNNMLTHCTREANKLAS